MGRTMEVRLKYGAGVLKMEQQWTRGAATEVMSGFHEHAVSMPLLPSCPDHLIEEERALL
jgi:hypothetical protein